MISELDYYELIRFKNGPISIESNRSARLQRIIDNKWIIPAGYIARRGAHGETDFAPNTWILSPAGEDLVAEYEKLCAKTSQERTDKHRDRIFQVLLALVSATLGVIGTLLVQWIF